jgi:hypothetical protein
MIHFAATLERLGVTMRFSILAQPESWRCTLPRASSPSFRIEKENGSRLMVTSNYYPELWVAGGESPNPDVWLFLRGCERDKDEKVSVRSFLTESAAIRAFDLSFELLTEFIKAAVKTSPEPTRFRFSTVLSEDSEVAEFFVRGAEK